MRPVTLLRTLHRYRAWLLLLTTICAACGSLSLPKCPAKSVRVFCVVDLYTAEFAPPGGPKPSCIESKTQINLTWCAKIDREMGMSAVTKLLDIIARTWPLDMFTWSQRGGLYAGPRVTKPPSPPCAFADANPNPELSPIDLDRGPGVVPQGAPGGTGGAGGGPSLPACVGPMPSPTGGGFMTCGDGAEGAPCETAADCSTCFCLPTGTGPQCEFP